jgi:hypothetical protein
VAQSHTPCNSCVRFVAGVAVGSRNTRFQVACWALPGPDFHRLIAPASWRTFVPPRWAGVAARGDPCEGAVTTWGEIRMDGICGFDACRADHGAGVDATEHRSLLVIIADYSYIVKRATRRLSRKIVRRQGGSVGSQTHWLVRSTRVKVRAVVQKRAVYPQRPLRSG